MNRQRVRSGRVGKVLATVALTLSSVVAAPIAGAATFFGVHAGGHLWRPDLSGTIGQSRDAFDFAAEFDDSSADSESVYVAIEHFLPLIPNVLARRTPVDWSSSSSSATGSLGSLSLSGEVDASVDLTATDATLYYEILDNFASLDIGLTLRQLDGFAEARERNTGLSERLNISGTIPMLYGHVRFDLPFSGLAAGVRGSATSFRSNQLLDTEAYLHFEVDLFPLVDVGLQGGVRSLSLELEDFDNLNTDARLQGAFIGITASF